MKKIRTFVFATVMLLGFGLVNFSIVRAQSNYECVSCTEINDDAWCMAHPSSNGSLCQKAFMTFETCNQDATNQGFCNDFLPPKP